MPLRPPPPKPPRGRVPNDGADPMKRGGLRRSGLLPLLTVTLLAVGTLAGALAAGWGPKLGLDLEGGFSVTLQPIEDTDDDTLDQAIEIIRTRVDAFGVAEPEITRQGDTIVVSLPGVTDRDRARELVGQTAELRFRPVLTPPIDGSLDDALATSTTIPAAPSDPPPSTTEAPVQGQAAAGVAVPYQDPTTPTTTTHSTPTTAPSAPPDSVGVTPRDEDDPAQPVILEEVKDGQVVATYSAGA